MSVIVPSVLTNSDPNISIVNHGDPYIIIANHSDPNIIMTITVIQT